MVACFTPELCQRIRQDLAYIQQRSSDTIEGTFSLQVQACTDSRIVFVAQTTPWMQNVGGIVHGGAYALMLDEAMGCVANGIRTSQEIAPTIQMQMNLHRPILPGEQVQISVSVLSATKHLIHVSAEMATATAPERICISANATFYCR